ncbi:hypothetical protein CBS101457_002622 [Exobasidium rhododendri]|nr:hypothetical protein CBS101457_002622 [Exobasidium rhododendri]
MRLLDPSLIIAALSCSLLFTIVKAAPVTTPPLQITEGQTSGPQAAETLSSASAPERKFVKVLRSHRHAAAKEEVDDLGAPPALPRPIHKIDSSGVDSPYHAKLLNQVNSQVESIASNQSPRREEAYVEPPSTSRAATLGTPSREDEEFEEFLQLLGGARTQEVKQYLQSLSPQERKTFIHGVDLPGSSKRHRSR